MYNSCPICDVLYNQTFESTEGGFEKSLKSGVTVAPSLCQQHYRLWEDNLVAVIEIDGKKRKVSSEGALHPADTVRTANVIYVQKEFFCVVCGSLPEDIFPVVYATEEVVRLITSNPDMVDCGE